MIRVKISCEGTTIAKNNFNPMIAKFLPGFGNVWKNCEFYWNDDTVKEADYWIIIGDINSSEEQCFVAKKNIIFMSGEPPSIKKYDSNKQFINQFYRIFTCHENVAHPRVFISRPAINWWVDAGHPIKSPDEFNQWQNLGFGYDEFKKMTNYDKTKLISVFCSNKKFTAGHKMRHDFCLQAKEHFKDKLDWFGSGVNNIDSKWNGIAPYKYHIVLENGNYPDYWTEKLMDCYMTGAYPVYSGAPNINDYFDKDSLTTIDIRYPKSSFALIEKLIADETYEKSKQKILDAKNLVMDKYNLFNIISEIASKDTVNDNKELMIIRNEKFFLDKESHIFIKTKRGFFQKIFRSIAKKIYKLKLIIIDNFLLIKLKINKR